MQPVPKVIRSHITSTSILSAPHLQSDDMNSSQAQSAHRVPLSDLALSTASGGCALPMTSSRGSTSALRPSSTTSALQASSTHFTMHTHLHAPPIAPVARASHKQQQSELNRESVADGIAQVYDQKKEKMKVLQKFLENHYKRCPVCWVFECDGLNCASHDFAWHCPHFAQHQDDYKSFKKALALPGFQVCYFCLIPQGDIFKHPLPAARSHGNADACKYKDFLKPLLYLICTLPGKLESVLKYLDVPLCEWPTTNALPEYLAGKSDYPEALINLLEVLVAYIKLRQLQE
jgi:hypothetical protein